MATLLHIDSSLNGDRSVSRALTQTFRQVWEAEHPGGTVVYRDLAAEPLPHTSAEVTSAAYTAPDDRTPGQQAAMARRELLIKELEDADAVVLGAPMYNWAIPSTLKAWLDQVIMMGRTTGSDSVFAGTPIVVVASRGGAYGPGTPQEGNDFAIPYLRYVLGTQFGMAVDFVVPELTMARTIPAMADLVDMSDASRAQAETAAKAKAKALAAQFA